jgi:hypothetical protein
MDTTTSPAFLDLSKTPTLAEVTAEYNDHRQRHGAWTGTRRPDLGVLPAWPPLPVLRSPP